MDRPAKNSNSTIRPSLPRVFFPAILAWVCRAWSTLATTCRCDTGALEDPEAFGVCSYFSRCPTIVLSDNV